jgi:hypothetical protein
MDPLSALSLAASVVQFVEFAAGRCRDVKRLYDAGDDSLLKVAAFSATSHSFDEFSAMFRERQKFLGVGTGSGEEAEAVGSLVTCA